MIRHHARSLLALVVLLALLVPRWLPSATARPVALIGDSWWNTAWKYRVQITFKNASSGAALYDHRVLVELTPARVNYANMQPQGQDLRFVDPESSIPGSYLPHQIVHWNPGGNSYIFV